MIATSPKISGSNSRASTMLITKPNALTASRSMNLKMKADTTLF
jgi:hypothetical protein